MQASDFLRVDVVASQLEIIVHPQVGVAEAAYRCYRLRVEVIATGLRQFVKRKVAEARRLQLVDIVGIDVVARQHEEFFGRDVAVTILTQRLHQARVEVDRKSTRLNSSHVKISYAVFCSNNKKK